MSFHKLTFKLILLIRLGNGGGYINNRLMATVYNPFVSVSIELSEAQNCGLAIPSQKPNRAPYEGNGNNEINKCSIR